MAIGGSDALLFGAQIKFDKTGGVTDADINNILGKIQNMIKKKELWVKIGVDPNSTTFLRNYGKSASELTAKIKEANHAIERLQKQGNYWNGSGLTKAAQQVQQHIHELTMLRKYSSMTGTEFERMIVKSLKEETKERERAAKAAQKQAEANKKVGAEMQKQHGYLENLIRRMTVYASIGALGGFLQKIRDVTAEFELQRVSLGAIIQDQNRANQLFSEIKSFALKSPVKILDLTKYVKQVAAYRIETDKLFDTTKRLADVSVGLGVDMQRIVLAYGQVKAASYLRAAEVRQFTEAGIPLLELLAEKFSEVEGHAVSTEQVMERISKRGVGFDKVEEIFKDMTDAGGMFYNMQEKQGNTLFGMWAKLGDAASVMYDKIGNTDAVNNAMKSSIELMTDLMRNWKATATAIGTLGGVAALGMIGKSAYKRGQDIDVSAKSKVAAAEAKATAATQARATAQERLNKAIASGTIIEQQKAREALNSAVANEKAAQSEFKRATGLAKLGAGFKSLMGSIATGLGIGAVIAAVTTLVYQLKKAWDDAHRLKNELKDIEAKNLIDTESSVRNFERLAKEALSAADGSAAQQKALDELHRTYKDMIPVEQMTIENLRKLAGNYDILTNSIREYMAERRKQQMIEAYQEEYGAKIIKNTKALVKALQDQGKLGLEESQNIVTNLLNAVDKAAIDGKGFKNGFKALQDAASEAGVEIGEELAISIINAANNFWSGITDDYAYTGLIDAQYRLAAGIQSVENAAMSATGITGEYAKVLKDLNDTLANPRITGGNTFGEQQQALTERNNEIYNAILEAFKIAKVEFQDEWADLVYFVDSNNLGHVTTIQFDAIIEAISKTNPKLAEIIKVLKQKYNEMVPPDRMVTLFRNRAIEIANTFGRDFINKISGNLMKSGETVEEYRKRIVDELDTLKKALISFAAAKNIAKSTEDIAALDQLEKETQQKIDFYNKLLADIPSFDIKKTKTKKEKTSTKKGKTPEDQRLQTWQEIVQLMEKANQEYDKLEKKEGSGLAGVHIGQAYGEWFEYVNSLKIIREGLKAIKKSDFKFQIPTSVASLKKQLEIIQQVYEYYRKLGSKAPKGIQKSFLDLGTQISSLQSDIFQKQIEQKLQEISNKISKSKTAKEFYDKILSQTGDIDLAASVSMSIYGEIGAEAKKHMVEEIKALVDGAGLATTIGDMYVDLSDQMQGVINYDTFDIDYRALEIWAETFKDKLGGINGEIYKKLIKIAQEGQKEWAKTYDGYLKDLQKAETYSEKRIELARKTAEAINDIRYGELKNLPDAEKDRLIAGQRAKEAKEAANLAYEAFKDSPMYVQMFEDLDYASTTMLENMKKRLQAMQGEWKNLDPTQLKEMQSRLNEINNQLVKRNPFKTLTNAMKEYRELSANGGSRKKAERELAHWTSMRESAERQLNKILEERPEGKETEEYKLAVSAAKNLYNTAKKNEDEAAKIAERWKNVKDTIGLSVTELFQVLDMAGQIARGIADIADAFGADQNDVQFFNDIAEGLDNISGGVQDIITSVLQGNVIGIVSSALTAIPKMIVGFTQIFNADKIRRTNREIERQERLLHDLEYTYDRLQKAQEKLFGSDYIQNYNTQLANLEAQAEAYKKQAEAEKSKGKKADKDAIQDYEDSWRDTMDEIKDMRDDLQDYLLGTDLTSAARDWANAWLEARWSFADTTEAMKEKFADMVQNMIVESMAARIMENVLSPVYEAIDKATADQDITAEEIAEIAELGYKAIGDANIAMEGLLTKLQDAGLNLQDMFGEAGDLTGISRDIATASEESINGLAQGINTQNYYISYVSENVAAIRAIMEGGTTASVGSGMDLISLQNEHLSQLPVIAANTLATAERCERAAIACESIQETLERVVDSRGNKHVINTTMY